MYGIFLHFWDVFEVRTKLTQIGLQQSLGEISHFSKKVTFVGNDTDIAYELLNFRIENQLFNFCVGEIVGGVIKNETVQSNLASDSRKNGTTVKIEVIRFLGFHIRKRSKVHVKS